MTAHMMSAPKQTASTGSEIMAADQCTVRHGARGAMPSGDPQSERPPVPRGRNFSIECTTLLRRACLAEQRNDERKHYRSHRHEPSRHLARVLPRQSQFGRDHSAFEHGPVGAAAAKVAHSTRPERAIGGETSFAASGLLRLFAAIVWPPTAAGIAPSSIDWSGPVPCGTRNCRTMSSSSLGA